MATQATDEPTPTGAPGPGRVARWSRLVAKRLMVWRSPPDQPAWARPVLLGITGLAVLGYAWGANSDLLEPFYGAAARSMSQSWHDFIFGALDPLGTVSVDKLPGALWLQALSLRIFGFHTWAVVLPQILEGAASILVLYRCVRRLAGPLAGIAAAVVLAATPITMATSRGNVSDSLLILLTVLAADATLSAVRSGRLRTLLMAGVWVGLAFQAKMLQAWLVVPALGAAYLLAAPGPLRVRIRHVIAAGVVVVVVSLSWMSAVSLVPANQRPYFDGSHNNSLFSQVFVYNGYGRLGRSEFESAVGARPTFLAALAREGGSQNASTAEIKPGWDRLLRRGLGRDGSWLFPAMLLAALLIVRDRRRKDRRDLRRAGLVLWAAWLLILAVSFSSGVYVNSYYLAALSPAIAAIAGLGVELYWRRRDERASRMGLLSALILTACYGTFLLSGGYAVPEWVLPVCLVVSGAGALALLLLPLLTGRRRSLIASAFALACLLPFPATAAALVVSRGLGPFNIPYARQPLHLPSQAALETKVRAGVDELAAVGTRIPFAMYTSLLASEFILASGKEVLPIGGYLGETPTPTISQLARYVATGELRFVFVPIRPVIHDARILWVRAHCKLEHVSGSKHGIALGFFDCSHDPL